MSHGEHLKRHCSIGNLHRLTQGNSIQPFWIASTFPSLSFRICEMYLSSCMIFFNPHPHVGSDKLFYREGSYWYGRSGNDGHIKYAVLTLLDL